MNSSLSASPIISATTHPSKFTASLLGLPTEIRIKIIRFVVHVPHPLYLFQEPGRAVEAFAPDRPRDWFALLGVCKKIYVETRPLIYAEHCFHFLDITRKQVDVLRNFLESIGAANAASLSCLCVNFPVIVAQPGIAERTQLRDDAQQSLQLLLEKCTNLSTLEAVIHYKNADIFSKPDEVVSAAVLHVDASMRRIPTLKEIVIRIEAYEKVSPLHIQSMKALSWRVIQGPNL